MEDALLQSGRFSLPRQKILMNAGTVSQRSWWARARCHVNTPKKWAGPIRVPLSPRQQRDWYSGKKKRHTLKLQLLIHPVTRQVLCIATGRGAIHPDDELPTDVGHQGIQHQHASTRTPKEVGKHHPLTDTRRTANRRLAQVRFPVEHVIRRLEIFRILKVTYRHRGRRFHLRVNLIAALCNRIHIQP